MLLKRNREYKKIISISSLVKNEEKIFDLNFLDSEKEKAFLWLYQKESPYIKPVIIPSKIEIKL